MSKNEFFWIQIFIFGFIFIVGFANFFLFCECKRLTNKLSKTASKCIVQEMIYMNLFMSHAFFFIAFFQPNKSINLTSQTLQFSHFFVLYVKVMTPAQLERQH